MPTILVYLIGLFMLYRIIKNLSFLFKNMSSPVDKKRNMEEDIIEADFKHID